MSFICRQKIMVDILNYAFPAVYFQNGGFFFKMATENIVLVFKTLIEFVSCFSSY